MSHPYNYADVPKLPRRVVDMANADIAKYHEGKAAFDDVFAESWFKAQDRVHLELVKMTAPGNYIRSRFLDCGFLPRGHTVSDPLAVETMLMRRDQLRAEGMYSEADVIRKSLEALEYEIGDEAGGTNWIMPCEERLKHISERLNRHAQTPH